MDFELKEEFYIIIRVDASGLDGAGRSNTLSLHQRIIFNVINVDDNAPVFESLADQGLTVISENESTLFVSDTVTDAAVLFTALAVDGDGDGVTHAITAGNENGIFAINAETGVVTLASGQTLAQGTTYTLTISASSTSDIVGAQTKTTTHTVNVTVASPPTLSLGSNTATRNEGNVGESAIELTDVTISSGSGYIFTTSDDRFEVVGGKLRIKANASFDYDDGSDRNLVVTISATKEGHEPLTQSFTLAIQDINDEGPIVTRALASTAENYLYASKTVVNGSETHYYEASADILLSNNISGILSGTSPVSITLYHDTGPIEISGAIENFTNLVRGSYFIWAVKKGNAWSLTAVNQVSTPPTEGVSEAYFLHTFVITSPTTGSTFGTEAIATGQIVNVGAPSISLDISENLDIDTVIYTVAQAIPDVPDAIITYELLEQAGHRYFSFDANSREIKIKSNIDAEVETVVTVIIRATATTGSGDDALVAISDQVISLTINNVDEFIPIILKPSQAQSDRLAITLNENHDPATPIRTVQATDADRGEHITYRIVSQTQDGLFVIDETTGVLKLAPGMVLDAELQNTLQVIEIKAYSGQPERSSESYFLDITIVNVNDNAPTLSLTGVQTVLEEGTYIADAETGYQVTFADADGGVPVVTVSDARFAVKEDGHLVIKKDSIFDFETEPNVVVTITVVDTGEGGTALAGQDISVTQTITISITDVFETTFPPNISLSETSVDWTEGQQYLSVNSIARVSVLNGVNYDLTVNDERFIITNGLLFLRENAVFDFETEQSIKLLIKAAKPTAETLTARFTVNIIDVNDVAPAITRSKVYYGNDVGQLITLTSRHLNYTDQDTTLLASNEVTYKVLTLANGVNFYKQGLILNAQDTFTHQDLLDGRIMYKITDISSLTGMTLGISDPNNMNTASSTFVFSPRHVPVPLQTPNQNNGSETTINLAHISADSLIKTGNGKDNITASKGSDEIYASGGDDVITLDDNLTDNDTGGEDTVIYNFLGKSVFVAQDGGDKIIGFRRGEDILNFQAITDDPRIQTMDGFFDHLKGSDKSSNQDDLLMIAPHFSIETLADGTTSFSVNGIQFHFQGTTDYDTGGIAGGHISLFFDEALSWAEFIKLISISTDQGSKDTNYDYGRSIIKDISVLPNLLGDGSFVFKSLGREFGVLDIPDKDHTIIISGSEIGNIGTSARELFLGNGNHSNSQNQGGDDIFALGSGNNLIVLADGAETVFYRFQSSNEENGKSTSIDGSDFINNFELGKDKIVLVDINPLGPFDTIGDFGLSPNQLSVSFTKDNNSSAITGLSLQFNKASYGNNKTLRINFNQDSIFQPMPKQNGTASQKTARHLLMQGFCFKFLETRLTLLA